MIENIWNPQLNSYLGTAAYIYALVFLQNTQVIITFFKIIVKKLWDIFYFHYAFLEGW